MKAANRQKIPGTAITETRGQDNTMQRKFRIGQIGIGHNHAEGNLSAFRLHPELFEIVGYSEESEDWLEKRGGLACYRGIPRMDEDTLIDACDALLIETEVPDLMRAARKCIDRNKHIHLDKPAGENLEEYAGILRDAEKKGLVVHLGYLYRTNPAVQKVFSVAESGALGNILYVETAMSAPRSKEYLAYLESFRGGTMYIFGGHIIDFVLRLMGTPKKIEPILFRSGAEGYRGIDNATALFYYDKGVSVIRTSAIETGGHFRRELTVVGEKGTVCISPFERPKVKWLAVQNGEEDAYDKLADTFSLDFSTDYDRYDAFPKEFYDRLSGVPSPIYTYEYELTLHKLLLASCGIKD